MKRILLPVILLMSATNILAQVGKTDDVKKSLSTTNKDTVCWEHGGIFTLGINEGFLHNWAAGGEVASLSINSVLHGNITYYHHSSVWTNNLDLAYGLNYAQSTGFLPKKTDDRIDFTSNFGSRLNNSKNFYFAGLFNFKSQFTKGYDYSDTAWMRNPKSTFMSPAYLTLAAGMEYKRGEALSLFLSPIAGREVLSDKKYTSFSKTGAFGIDSGKTSKFQLGAYFSGRYKKDLSKRTQFSTRLDLYCNYLAKDIKDDSGKVIKKDNPGNIQVYWDNLLVFKAYKSLSFTFGLTVVYDNNFPYTKTTTNSAGATVNKDQPGNDLGWVQINQVFSVGIAYKF